MDALLGGVVNVVEDALHFRTARQAILAANVSNADTPGYRRVDLSRGKDFSEHLAISASGARHLGTSRSGTDATVERSRAPARLDGNNVNLDRELVELSRNAGAFTEQAAVMSRLIEVRRLAITGR